MTAMQTLENLRPIAADLTLLGGIFLLLLVDLAMPHGDKKRVMSWLALLALAGSAAVTFFVDLSGPSFGGAYHGDELALFFKRVFLVGGALAVLGSQALVASHFSRRQAEYYLLLLVSVFGMTLLGGTRDIILLLVCFELMSIPLYVLAAYQRQDALATEGALKLFLTGAVSSATMVFGFSLLFGVAGTTDLYMIASHVAANPSPAAALGITIALAGMGFKIGVFPFHMWVPDTYEGSTTPFVAFLASVPKAAGLVAIIQVLFAGDRSLLVGVTTLLIALAATTLVAGNLLALNQSNVKRLLGYSGVAHMGFLLMAIATGVAEGLATLMFYVVAYLFTTVGAFLVVHTVAACGGDDSLASFDGLGRRSGWLGMAMLVFLLSLAGIPFAVGFWAKLYVFVVAWAAGMEWLVVVAAVLSVLALFYYLRVARAMFMNEPPADAPAVKADFATNLGILLCLAAVVGAGLYPAPLVEAAQAAATAFFG